MIISIVDSHAMDNVNRAARKVNLSFLGLAFIAAIGCIDLGNFATNI
ncbi:hypothetical protein [Sodalis-like endosymbiont of Proechinophthirus fluctus]|nr:hypothetical protein [Sodalis-like endosymbiont of Proechinophthirus fluctus]